MNIAESIYQHVKTMPLAKAIEVLHFVEFLETKPDVIAKDSQENEAREFTQNLSVNPDTTETPAHQAATEDDFFNSAGLWENRDISQESIRAKAWRDKQK